MPDTSPYPSPSFHPETTLSNGVQPLISFSNACTELTIGVLEAGLAEIELAQSLYSDTRTWSSMAESMPQEAATKALTAARVKAELAVQRMREINDGLSSRLFSAVETMLTAWQAEAANAMRAFVGKNAAAR